MVFFCFLVNILKTFSVIAVSREGNAIPTGRPTPLENGTMETSPLSTVDVIRPILTKLVIVLIRAIIFVGVWQNSTSSSRFSLSFFKWYAFGSSSD